MSQADKNNGGPSDALKAIQGTKQRAARQDASSHFRGDRLTALRGQYRISQDALAELIGQASHSALSQYETGKREPSLKFIKALAYHFGTTTDWLLGMDEYEPEDKADSSESEQP